MKKSLLAVAVAAALPTFAQAQSSVTLFGLLDASVEYSDDQANATLGTNAAGAQTVSIGEAGLRLANGVGYGSRFGVRGTEDLGGGLKAIFTLEHRLNIDTGDTSGGAAFTAGNQKFWNGQAWVGLSGGWGQLTMGRQYSPIFWALIPADFTSYGYYNNWAAATGSNVGTAGAFITQGPIRLDNSLAYKSPTFGGLTVYATYAFGENLQNAAAPGGQDQAGTGDIWGLAAGWQLGGLYLAAGYHSADTKAFGTTGVSAQAAIQDVLAVTASYKWSSFGASIGYTQLNFNNIAGSDPNISNILFSAFANLGPGTLFVNAIQLEFADFTGARNDSGMQFGVTYRMPLSKRTDWYVSWGMNDYSGIQAVNATDVIDSQNRLALGIRHLF
jgi:predicted porin